MRISTKQLQWPSHFCFVTALNFPNQLLPAIKAAIDNDETYDVRGPCIMCQYRVRNIRVFGVKFCIYVLNDVVSMVERTSCKDTLGYLVEMIRTIPMTNDEWFSICAENLCYPQC